MGSSGRKAQLSVCRLWQAASYINSQDAKPSPVPTPRATPHELEAHQDDEGKGALFLFCEAANSRLRNEVQRPSE